MRQMERVTGRLVAAGCVMGHDVRLPLHQQLSCDMHARAHHAERCMVVDPPVCEWTSVENTLYHITLYLCAE